MKPLRNTFLLTAILLLASCAGNAPASLSPAGVKSWQANEVVVAVGTLQRTAIALNGVQRCDPEPCQPVLSDKNTRTVIDAVEVSLKTIEASPDGWRAAAATALTEIRTKVDAAGLTKLQPYIAAAQTVLDQFGGVK